MKTKKRTSTIKSTPQVGNMVEPHQFEIGGIMSADLMPVQVENVGEPMVIEINSGVELSEDIINELDAMLNSQVENVVEPIPFNGPIEYTATFELRLEHLDKNIEIECVYIFDEELIIRVNTNIFNKLHLYDLYNYAGTIEYYELYELLGNNIKGEDVKDSVLSGLDGILELIWEQFDTITEKNVLNSDK